MMFAEIDYEGCCEKKKTEKIATEWAAMLQSTGMDVSTYVIEADQVRSPANARPEPRPRPRLSRTLLAFTPPSISRLIQVLFSTNSGSFSNEIKEYALKQPNCVSVTFNSNRVAGPAETPEWIEKNEAKKAAKAATKKAKDDAEAAVKRHEEKLKQKKKAAKRRKKAEKEEM